MPDDFDILELWERKSVEHSLVKRIIQEGKCYYISKDYLNFGGPVEKNFGNGVVFVGDSGGHVGAFGASGIISSMATGYACTDFLSASIKAEGWVTEERVQKFLSELDKSPVQRWLKKERTLGKTFRNMMFNELKTIEAIDENWGKIKGMMKS